ncbi:MAG: D-alanine--D-alanine ligase, partial [Deltaproteobacteria bacterium]|nr:D-alanine--D-alanine ligase [Deltaproteobacteria bacterium]
LEVNPNPDISRNAGLARSAGIGGLDYNKLIDGIVTSALQRYEGVGA